MNGRIINSVTRLHLVGCFYRAMWYTTSYRSVWYPRCLNVIFEGTEKKWHFVIEWTNEYTQLYTGKFDVRGSVRHSTIHKENPTRCTNVSKCYYSIFIWSSTCFGRHTAHHQEPKTALGASSLSYVEGCWTCSCQAHCAWLRPTATRPTTFHVWQTRGCQCSFRLLMLGGVSPETCWASYKYGIITFWYIVASFWIFFMN